MEIFASSLQSQSPVPSLAYSPFISELPFSILRKKDFFLALLPPGLTAPSSVCVFVIPFLIGATFGLLLCR